MLGKLATLTLLKRVYFVVLTLFHMSFDCFFNSVSSSTINARISRTIVFGFNMRLGIGQIIRRMVALKAFVSTTTYRLQECAYFKMMIFNMLLGDIYLVITKVTKSTTVQSVTQVVKETGQMDSFTICKIREFL